MLVCSLSFSVCLVGVGVSRQRREGHPWPTRSLCCSQAHCVGPEWQRNESCQPRSTDPTSVYGKPLLGVYVILVLALVLILAKCSWSNTYSCVNKIKAAVVSALWSAVAQRLKRRAFNRENPGSNPLAGILKLWQFHSSHISTVHSAV